MNSVSWVSIIALLGWLVLALSAYRSQQISASKTFRLLLIWGCVFLGVALVFSFIM